MSIKIGGVAVGDVKLGDVQIVKICRGADTVWQKEEPPAPVTRTSLLYVTVAAEQTLTVNLVQSEDYAVSVDWGDGASPVTSANNAQASGGLDYLTLSHEYAAAGDYVIGITPAEGKTWEAGVDLNNKLLGDATTVMTAAALGLGLTAIRYRAFYSYASLASVTFPEGLTEIGKDSFYSCTGLTSISVPASVVTIKDQAFRGCTSLTTITIPATVQTIDSAVFQGCTGLVTAEVAASEAGSSTLGILGQVCMIFSGCSALEKLWLRGSCETIYGNTWLTSIVTGCDPAKLTIYAEPASRPAEWAEKFNSAVNDNDVPVVWGQTTRPW